MEFVHGIVYSKYLDSVFFNTKSTFVVISSVIGIIIYLKRNVPPVWSEPKFKNIHVKVY